MNNGIIIGRSSNGVDFEDFDSLAWVLRARATSEKRPNLCGIYSDGMGQFAGTDGVRLHVAEIPKLSEVIPEGIWLYVHASTKKISLMQAPEDISVYPNYQRIIDIFNSQEPVDKGTLDHTLLDNSEIVWKYWDMVGLPCNIDYI